MKVIVVFGPGCLGDPKTLGLRTDSCGGPRKDENLVPQYLGKALSQLAGLQFGGKD